MKIHCLVVNEGSHAWWSMEGSHAWWSMKIPFLVANEGSHAWWPMKDPMFGGQWEEKKKVPCYLFPLPLEQLYLNLHFILFFIL